MRIFKGLVLALSYLVLLPGMAQNKKLADYVTRL